MKSIGAATACMLRQTIPARFRPIGYLSHLTEKRTNRRVRAGPFTGMRYGAESTYGCLLPKLLGTYERELADKVELICHHKSPYIIDIGAAEGYYAVGLAWRIPDARVIAFEMDLRGQRALYETASLNGVADRLDVMGRCEPEDLASVLTGDAEPVVICDVEGDEERLLDPAAVPGLERATMLVEMHEFARPGVTDLLHERFAPSHKIELIWQEPRSRAEFPWRTLGTTLLPVSYLDWAVSEWRPERMSWLWMTPKLIYG